MTQQSYSPIRTLSINDALATTSGIGLGKEFTVLDDITLNDLVDAPAQVGFLLIALCTEGQVDFTMNGRQCHMEPGDLLISFGEQIFRDGSSDGNFHAKAVLMSRTFAQNCLVGMDKMWPYLLFLMEHPVLTMTESEQLWLLECYQLIRKRLNRPHQDATCAKPPCRWCVPFTLKYAICSMCVCRSQTPKRRAAPTPYSTSL